MGSELSADAILTQAISHTEASLSSGEISIVTAIIGLMAVVAAIGEQWPERAEWSRARLRRWTRTHAH